MKKYHHNEISNFVQKAGEIMNSFILYIDGKMIFLNKEFCKMIGIITELLRDDIYIH